MLLDAQSTAELLSSLGSEYFPYKDTWLVAGDTQESLHGVYLPISSQVYSFTKEMDKMVIREMYKIDQALQMRVNQVGSWNGEVLSWDDASLFERRKDLCGYQFEAATSYYNSYH